MIITFQGTAAGKHNAGAIAVMFAALTSFRTNKRCLVMSLCNPDKGRNIEDYAYAKYMDDMDTNDPDNMFRFDDSGIDALVRRAETSGLNEENFSNCVSPTVQTERALDIIDSSKNDGFEEDITSRFHIVHEILDVASTMYDYIFIVSNSMNKTLTKYVGEVSNRVVGVVRQTNAIAPIKVNKDAEDKYFFLVGDYEQESAYNARFLKKSYGVKHLYVMPHNVKYRDASIQGQLVRFAMRNIEPSKADVNEYMISSLYRLMTEMFGNMAKPEEGQVPTFTMLPKGTPLQEKILDVRQPAILGTGTEKAGLFRKKTYQKATFPDEAESYNAQDDFDSDTEERNKETEEETPYKISVPEYADDDMNDPHEEAASNVHLNDDLEVPVSAEESPQFVNDPSQENLTLQNDDDEMDTSQVAPGSSQTDQEETTTEDCSEEVISIMKTPIDIVYKNIFENAIVEHGSQVGTTDMHSDQYLAYMRENGTDHVETSIPIEGLFFKDEAVKAVRKYLLQWAERNPNFALISLELSYGAKESFVRCSYVPYGHFNSGIAVRNSLKKAYKEMQIATEKDWIIKESSYLSNLVR